MPTERSPEKLLYVLTSAQSAVFLRGQLSWMRAAGYHVTVVASGGETLRTVCEGEGVEHIALPMSRNISPLADLVTLYQLTRLFLKLRPDVVNAGTPKAGLLGMLAAFAARVPARVYVLRGLRLETTIGWRRKLLWASELVASLAAHRVVCVSASLRAAYVEAKAAPFEKTQVIGKGSSNGVDCDRFAPPLTPDVSRSAVRERWGLPADAFVYGFVGRLTRDKGLPSLVEAFEEVVQACPDAHLLIVGPLDKGDGISTTCFDSLRNHERIVCTGALRDVRPAYAAMDVLVHPSLREGFANAPCEASASGLAVIGRQVTGVVDPVVHGETGLLVSPRGSGPLAEAMTVYYRNRDLAKQHGLAGRKRMQQYFKPQSIWQGLLELYNELLAQNGRSAPTTNRPSCDERTAIKQTVDAA